MGKKRKLTAIEEKKLVRSSLSSSGSFPSLLTAHEDRVEHPRRIKQPQLTDRILTYSIQGNEAYHSQNYNLALERYTKAIEKGSKDDKSDRATYYLNRAQALLKLER